LAAPGRIRAARIRQIASDSKPATDAACPPARMQPRRVKHALLLDRLTEQTLPEPDDLIGDRRV
jgi:hypothetical protein